MRMKVEKHMEHLDTICAPPSVISATQLLSYSVPEFLIKNSERQTGDA